MHLFQYFNFIIDTDKPTVNINQLLAVVAELSKLDDVPVDEELTELFLYPAELKSELQLLKI